MGENCFAKDVKYDCGLNYKSVTLPYFYSKIESRKKGLNYISLKSSKDTQDLSKQRTLVSNVAVHSCLNVFEGVIRFCFSILRSNMDHLPAIAARLESRQAEEIHITAEYFLPTWLFLSLTSVRGMIFLGTKSDHALF